MKVGQLVNHAVYGKGSVIAVFESKQLGDGGWPDLSQSSIIKTTNGKSRYDGNLNITVRFDNGGPMGWATNSTNDISELELL